MVGRVAGRGNRAQGGVTKRQLGSCFQLADVRSRFGLELAASRHEVVVKVRVEGVCQLDVQVGGDVQIALDIAQRVDDQANATVCVGDDKARVAKLWRRDRLDCVHGISCR